MGNESNSSEEPLKKNAIAFRNFTPQPNSIEKSFFVLIRVTTHQSLNYRYTVRTELEPR